MVSMKILLTTESYYPNVDGGAIGQYYLVNELLKKGHDTYQNLPLTIQISFLNYKEKKES